MGGGVWVSIWESIGSVGFRQCAQGEGADHPTPETRKPGGGSGVWSYHLGGHFPPFFKKKRVNKLSKTIHGSSGLKKEILLPGGPQQQQLLARGDHGGQRRHIVGHPIPTPPYWCTFFRSISILFIWPKGGVWSRMVPKWGEGVDRDLDPPPRLGVCVPKGFVSYFFGH